MATSVQLQFAIDAPEHFALIPAIARYFDLIEVGTPVLKRFGLSAISTARELADGRPVIADTKTADGGALEAEMIFGAGATGMTVLAQASPATRRAVLDIAARDGRTLILDTVLGVPPDLQEVVTHAPEEGIWLGLHTGSDARLSGVSTDRAIDDAVKWGDMGLTVMLAGGIGRANLDESLRTNAAVIVIGSSVSAASNPEGEAAWIRDRVDASTHGS